MKFWTKYSRNVARYFILSNNVIGHTQVLVPNNKRSVISTKYITKQPAYIISRWAWTWTWFFHEVKYQHFTPTCLTLISKRVDVSVPNNSLLPFFGSFELIIVSVNGVLLLHGLDSQVTRRHQHEHITNVTTKRHWQRDWAVCHAIARYQQELLSCPLSYQT